MLNRSYTIQLHHWIYWGLTAPKPKGLNCQKALPALLVSGQLHCMLLTDTLSPPGFVLQSISNPQPTLTSVEGNCAHTQQYSRNDGDCGIDCPCQPTKDLSFPSLILGHRCSLKCSGVQHHVLVRSQSVSMYDEWHDMWDVRHVRCTHGRIADS